MSLKIWNMPDRWPGKGKPKARQDRFFKVENLIEGVPEIFIYDVIDADWGIGARQVIEALEQIGIRDTITVRLSSPGGDAMEAANIVNALTRNPAKIQISIDGQALSAGATIALAGNTISMSNNALLMFHKPYTGMVGNDEQFIERAAVLTRAEDNIANMIVESNRKKMTFDDAKALMKGKVDGTWYNADEALESGFIDEITPSLAIAAYFDPDNFQGVPASILARNDSQRGKRAEINARLDSMLLEEI